MSFIHKRAQETLIKCKKVVDVLRKFDSTDKNTIVSESKLSWATVNSYLDELLESEIIKSEENHFSLSKDFLHMVGISIGVTEIKVSIINLGFKSSEKTKEVINEIAMNIPHSLNISDNDEYICIATPNKFTDCYDIINSIIDSVLNVYNIKYNLLSIGMSLPGLMDKYTHIMEFSPNLPWLVNINVYALIRRDIMDRLTINGVLFGIYHDMDAVTVYEKESLTNYTNLKLDKHNDVLCLFMSYGIGSTLIKNNSLRLFCSSEHGHIMTSVEPQESKSLCACGQNCLENQIRNKIFDSKDIVSFYEKTTPDNLQNLSKEKYYLMCQYIGFLFNHIINTMRVDMIILSGRIFNGIPQLKFDMDKIRIGNTIPALSNKCLILNGCSKPDIAAVGAAMISYYNMTLKQQASELIITW